MQATTTKVGELGAHFHQPLNYAPDLELRDMTLDPKAIVSKAAAAELPPDLTWTSCRTANTPRGKDRRTIDDYENAEAIFSDCCGPMTHVGFGGELYFVTFIDVKTRFTAEIPIIRWDELSEFIEATFNNFIDEYGRRPKIFVSDNAEEYASKKV